MTKRDADKWLHRLSSPQVSALLALLAGDSITDAAKAAGVARQRVSAWVNSPGDFQRALTELRREPVEQARQGLKQLTVKATRALSEILSDPQAPAGSKVQAAGVVYRAAGLAGSDTSVSVNAAAYAGSGADPQVEYTERRITEILEGFGRAELARFTQYLTSPGKVDAAALVSSCAALPAKALKPFERLLRELVKAGKIEVPAPRKAANRKRTKTTRKRDG